MSDDLDFSAATAARWTWQAEEIRRVGHQVVDLIAQHLTQLQANASAQTIRAAYTATGSFVSSSGTLAGGETINPFALTVTGVTANN